MDMTVSLCTASDYAVTITGLRRPPHTATVPIIIIIIIRYIRQDAWIFMCCRIE